MGNRFDSSNVRRSTLKNKVQEPLITKSMIENCDKIKYIYKKNQKFSTITTIDFLINGYYYTLLSKVCSPKFREIKPSMSND